MHLNEEEKIIAIIALIIYIIGIHCQFISLIEINLLLMQSEKNAYKIYKMLVELMFLYL